MKRIRETSSYANGIGDADDDEDDFLGNAPSLAFCPSGLAVVSGKHFGRPTSEVGTAASNDVPLRDRGAFSSWTVAPAQRKTVRELERDARIRQLRATHSKLFPSPLDKPRSVPSSQSDQQKGEKKAATVAGGPSDREGTDDEEEENDNEEGNPRAAVPQLLVAPAVVRRTAADDSTSSDSDAGGDDDDEALPHRRPHAHPLDPLGPGTEEMMVGEPNDASDTVPVAAAAAPEAEQTAAAALYRPSRGRWKINPQKLSAYNQRNALMEVPRYVPGMRNVHNQLGDPRGRGGRGSRGRGGGVVPVGGEGASRGRGALASSRGGNYSQRGGRGGP